MRRFLIGVTSLFLALLACRAFSLTPATPTPQPPTATATATPPPTLTNTPTSTATALPPTRTAIPASPTPTVLDFELLLHPDGGLFVGDQVSFEVLPPSELDLQDATLRIELPQEAMLEARFFPFGIAGRNQATLFWGWDTTGLEAGAQSLTFSIQPLGYTWTQTITLAAAAELPVPEPLAHWTTSESDCCLFYYISETAAAREITATLALADQQAAHAMAVLGDEFSEPLVITLMPRVLGQGGFATNEMYISFLDRNYAGNDFGMVLHHEMVHVLDQRLGGNLRPTILIEGLAVYLSGGHYKPEALAPRAAALLAPAQRADGLGLGWYLPLTELANDFYQSQHEIGYIQAGALVEYLVDTWGWESFSAFYRDIQPVDGGGQAAALDAALQAHFGRNLADLETDFVAMLQAQPITPETVADVRLTVTFFEVMRRYQQALDPSAYYLTAWLPDGPMMRERGIVADLLRHPAMLENLALETLLVAADAAMDGGDVDLGAQALDAVGAVLDALEAGAETPFAANPLAQAHFELAQLVAELGYTAEKIEVGDESARVIASQGWPELTVFEFKRVNGDWRLAQGE
ncbi:MAG TPA: hypothetical protein DEH22_01570 [Chloroflexi bacterium]|nr:hypothetical protein [Chloroflexota bacterium]